MLALAPSRQSGHASYTGARKGLDQPTNLVTIPGKIITLRYVTFKSMIISGADITKINVHGKSPKLHSRSHKLKPCQ